MNLLKPEKVDFINLKMLKTIDKNLEKQYLEMFSEMKFIKHLSIQLSVFSDFLIY